MKPPETPDTDAGTSPAALSCLQGLKVRRDFLACSRGRKAVMPGFVLQGRDRRDGTATTRIGFTASKKVGNAVARNRAKRRLRALARELLPAHGQPGWDYVLVARADSTTTLPFDTLRTDLVRALAKLHPPRSPS